MTDGHKSPVQQMVEALHGVSRDLSLTRNPDARIVHLRPVPTDGDVARHPSRPRLDLTEARTVPLTFAGGEWDLIVRELHRSPYPAVQQCGDVIADALENS